MRYNVSLIVSLMFLVTACAQNKLDAATEKQVDKAQKDYIYCNFEKLKTSLNSRESPENLTAEILQECSTKKDQLKKTYVSVMSAKFGPEMPIAEKSNEMVNKAENDLKAKMLEIISKKRVN